MARRSIVRVLEDSDIAWLMDKYRRCVQKEPGLSIKDFALDYGIDPKILTQADPRTTVVHLYHGTTRDRAEKILEEGFRGGKVGKRWIWFATQRAFAERVANARSRARNQPPVVFECNIDLAKYTDHVHSGPMIYAFRCECIYPQVIVNQKRIKREIREPAPRKVSQPKPTERLYPDICITRQSRSAGIAFWLNAFFELDGEDAFQADSPLVKELEVHMTALFDENREQIASEEMAVIVNEFLREE